MNFVSKILVGLNNDLKAVKGHLLAGDMVPTLNDAYSRLQRITSSTKPDQSSKDNFAFVANRGRGRGHDRRGGHGSTRQTSDRAARHCTYFGKPNHTVETCRAKHGKSEWATQLANHAVLDDGTDTVSPIATKPIPSSEDFSTSLRDDINQLLRRLHTLEASSNTSNSASTSAATLAHTGSSHREDDWWRA
ncbi:uncharacterized protein LOC122063210 [Macadamia integrifolia]|uniref:uncharacterized protein LOC122063210 n=1 Tax=Macadamia integrifolia TaxID=60698 RepID=UPI001C4FD2DD|nr:uncharacterized protein LOC122063210 [Macadamia integrifolia]